MRLGLRNKPGSELRGLVYAALNQYGAPVKIKLRKWIRAGGRKLKGLVRRREAEARLCAVHRPFSSLGGKGTWSKEGLTQARAHAFSRLSLEHI